MGDKLSGAVSQGQPGQAGNVSPEGTTEGAASKPVTLEQVQDLLSKQEQNLRNEVGKQIQSQVDKADFRITDKLRAEFQNIDTTVKRLKDAGQEVSPQAVERMKQQALMDEFAGQHVQGDGSGKPDLAQGQKQGQPKGVIPQSPIVATALALMQEEGVFIVDNDPEIKMIDLKTTSPKALLKSVEAAIEAKKQRLSGASTNGQPEKGKTEKTDKKGDAEKIAARNPSTGVKTGKSVGATPEGLTSMDYFKRAYNK